MNELCCDSEDGILEEADFWKLFTDHPDKASETVVFYHDIKPSLSKVKLEDDGRLYQVYSHSVGFPERADDACVLATVSQRNLRQVAKAIDSLTGQCAAIQYLGPTRINENQKP